jgi:hypothetical protein
LNINKAHMVSVNRVHVLDDYRIGPSDIVEFFGVGLKGMDELLTPTELMKRWNIDNSQYHRWISEGLPCDELMNGEIRHFGAAVDEWCRHRRKKNSSGITSVHPRLSVDLEAETATLDGMTYPLDRTYLWILDSLLRRPRGRTSRSDMVADHSELSCEPRLDRVIRSLRSKCPAIGRLIRSTPRGYFLE